MRILFVALVVVASCMLRAQAYFGFSDTGSPAATGTVSGAAMTGQSTAGYELTSGGSAGEEAQQGSTKIHRGSYASDDNQS